MNLFSAKKKVLLIVILVAVNVVGFQLVSKNSEATIIGSYEFSYVPLPPCGYCPMYAEGWYYSYGEGWYYWYSEGWYYSYGEGWYYSYGEGWYYSYGEGWYYSYGEGWYYSYSQSPYVVYSYSQSPYYSYSQSPYVVYSYSQSPYVVYSYSQSPYYSYSEAPYYAYSEAPYVVFYTISGTVFIDTNGNGVQNCSGGCNNGAGDELGYGETSVRRVGPGADPSDTTDNLGRYSIPNTPDGSYVMTLTVPPGYTTPDNTLPATVGPNAVVNFPLQPATYSISGKVFVDSNSSGLQNCSGACDNGVGDEQNYSGATVTLVLPGPDQTDITDASGNYSFTGITAGTYPLSLTVPPDYIDTTTNPKNVTIGPDSTGNDFGIVLSDPDCPGGISVTDTSPDPGGLATLSVSTCTGVENPDDGNPPPPFDWDPPGGTLPECSDGLDNDGDTLVDTADPDCHTGGDGSEPYNPDDDDESPVGSDTCSDGGISAPTNTATSSTVTYTAPACPIIPLTCSVSVVVNGPGGETTYISDNISVAATYSIATNIRTVTDSSGCTAGSGDSYTGSSVGVNISGGNLPPGGDTKTTATGTTSFACLVSGDYVVTLSVPSGYMLMDRSGGVDSGANGIAFNSLASNQTANFCISRIDPWFQTDVGNARFLNLTNSLPENTYGSTDATYPGIFYSSESSAQFGFGSASVKNWVVDDEYSYNADTENRNGGMSYDFYKAKARQDGITITSISPVTLVPEEITQSGIYEANGDLEISNYTHANGRRVVILVNGNVTISDSSISIPLNQGLLIIAAKGNITFEKTIGQANPATGYTIGGANTFDGYYTAQGNIILDGDLCTDGATPDLRLNIGGALIANSLKPFSSAGTGTIQNRRSLCAASSTNPSLYISSRPDFLIQMTDFYKTSYTKWKEENP